MIKFKQISKILIIITSLIFLISPQYENRLKELEKEMQFMHEMKQIKSQLQNMDY